MIIGLSGKVGSGKDTVGDYFINEEGFERDTLAAPIKRLVSDIFQVPLDVVDGKNGKRKYREEVLENWPDWTIRKLLQYIGTEMFRGHISDDIWVRSLILRIKNSDKKNFVITDVRFPNEKQILADEFGDKFHMLQVVRPGANGDAGLSSHESEAYDIEGDFVINNVGTLEDLITASECALASFYKKEMSKLSDLK